MDEKCPPVVVKQEPVSDPEDCYMMPISPTPLSPGECEDSEEPESQPVPKKVKKSTKKEKSSTKRLQKKLKKIKKEPPDVGTKQVKKEKVKKKAKIGQDTYVEPPRSEVYPDRTMSDFYCKVCDAHMNSVQVWESHIQGKRHLKNIKKEKEGSAPVTIKKEKPDDVAGLYYIDTRGAMSPSTDTLSYDRRPPSPVESKWRHRTSPEPPSPPRVANYRGVNVGELNITTFERMNYMLQLSESLIPESDNDINEIKSIISALAQSVIQYEIRQLPFAVQQKLAKELFRGK